MQPPTCTGIRIRTARDAEVVFHAVALGLLPMVTRRLDSEERMSLSTGCVYVWEERGSHVSDSIEQGIERFTEGRSWGPSRARDDFLFYHEKENAPKSLMVERTRALQYQEDPTGSYMMYPRLHGGRMIKQTYSVYINGHAGHKKWHLNAYWTQETLDDLATVDDFPHLASLRVPEDLYICARTNRMRENAAKNSRSGAGLSDVHAHARAPPTYAPYPWSPSPRPAHAPHGGFFPPPPPPGPPPPPRPSPPSSSSSSSFPPHGLRLAPLEQLEGGRRVWRDPADERALWSLNRCHR
ncbi:Gti1/Pac2 family-domain-containing protein [Amylostereum chailletii]|nr:Gti1/Pac2 family-domain-containing protein [Amylostereum chailletii]